MADQQIEKTEISFPYEIKPVDPENNKNLLKDFEGNPEGYLQVGPKKYMYPSNFLQMANQYYNFQAKSDDVWIVTFPRSGTTLTQEIVWLLLNNFDYDATTVDSIYRRSPYLDQDILVHDTFKEKIARVNLEVSDFFSTLLNFIKNKESPRVIKTHLPFSILPPSIFELNCKIVYIARNPMDVSVSLYHLYRFFKCVGYISDFKTFWEYYEKGLVIYGPHLPHIAEAWAERNKSNIFFEYYENIINDLPQYIRKLAKFLNKEISQLQMEKLLDHLNINNFKNNLSVNNMHKKVSYFINKGEQSFIRKGKIMDNAEEFTPELRERAIKWIKENMKNYNFKFPIEEFN